VRFSSSFSQSSSPLDAPHIRPLVNVNIIGIRRNVIIASGVQFRCHQTKYQIEQQPRIAVAAVVF
jgi:hypothetical protein